MHGPPEALGRWPSKTHTCDTSLHTTHIQFYLGLMRRERGEQYRTFMRVHDQIGNTL